MLGLLLVCLFAPYGLFSAGGGTLRPDHVLIPVVFAILLVTRRLAFPSPLCWTLYSLPLIAVLRTLLQLDVFLAEPLVALKNLDGLLRGPTVLLIASSFNATAANMRLLLRFLPPIAVTLAAFALVDRFAPTDSVVRDTLDTLYGGPVTVTDPGSIYVILGKNAKALYSLHMGRATAVFVTPPALAMASVFILVMCAVPGASLQGFGRIATVVAALVAGLASNSKSFVLGVPTASILLLFFARGSKARMGTLMAAIALLALFATAIVIIPTLTTSDVPVNPLSQVGDSNDLMYDLTAGRMGGAEGAVWKPLVYTLVNSPILGFGLNEVPGIAYCDSAVNRFMLHGGLVGTVLVTYGLVHQAHWFWVKRSATPWAATGLVLLLVTIGFFTAGTVFMMARLNDLLFILIGVSMARTRHVAELENFREPVGEAARASTYKA